jgi:hypothetical protein
MAEILTLTLVRDPADDRIVATLSNGTRSEQRYLSGDSLSDDCPAVARLLSQMLMLINPEWVGGKAREIVFYSGLPGFWPAYLNQCQVTGPVRRNPKWVEFMRLAEKFNITHQLTREAIING